MLLLGTEPSLRWRAFTQLVTGLATELGVSMVVTLGSLLADVPHTRPAPVTASASETEVLEQLGASAVALRGPDRRRRRAPRRLPRGRHPVGVAVGRGAALRLADPVAARGQGAVRPARRRCSRSGSTRASSRRRATAYIQQVSEAVAADEETAAYVDELESRAEEIDDETELPSGETLAAELTRFLREREQDGGEGSSARGEQ